MECTPMEKRTAAILLVDMVSELRAYGCDNQIYHEAVAVACAELMKEDEMEESHDRT